jgi:hypothetical protein
VTGGAAADSSRHDWRDVRRYVHGRQIRQQGFCLAGVRKEEELADPEKAASETILRKPAPDLHELSILSRTVHSVKYYWELIADNLSKAGWSLGYVSAIDANGRTIWIADAHRDDGRRCIVRADELLTAFLELESAIRGCASRSEPYWLAFSF